MKTIKVRLARRSYQIIIGFGVIKNLGREIKRLNLGTDAYIITNSLIKKRYGRTISRTLNDYGINYAFNTVADSERSKSQDSSLDIIQDLARPAYGIANHPISSIGETINPSCPQETMNGSLRRLEEVHPPLRLLKAG